MDFDTTIILVLLASALTWWFGIHVSEERKTVKANKLIELDRLEREERIKRLTNKL